MDSEGFDLSTAVKGLAVLSAIPVVLYALWAQYFSTHIDQLIQKDPKFDRSLEMVRVRLASLFGVLFEFTLFLGTSEIRAAFPILGNSYFIVAVGLQLMIQASCERKVQNTKPKSSANHGLSLRPDKIWKPDGKDLAGPSSGGADFAEPAGLALRIFLWAVFGAGMYLGALFGSVAFSAWLAHVTHASTLVSTVLVVGGSLVGIVAGLGLSFGLAPFQIRRMFPTRPLHPQNEESLLREFEKSFQDAKLRIPSFWVIEMEQNHSANAMIAGFRSGPGFFRPALFISKALIAQLSPAEIGAVVRHEISHLSLNHLRKRFLLSSGLIMASTLVAAFLILVGNHLAPSRELSSFISFAAAAVAFMLTYRWLGRQSRYQEIEADIYAVEKLGAKLEDLTSALRKLDRINQIQATFGNGNIATDKSDHPLTANRIRVLEAYFSKEKIGMMSVSTGSGDGKKDRVA